MAKKKAKKTAVPWDLNSFSVGLGNETDRACGVLGASMLDVRLEALFLRRLHAFQDELLGFGGPLGTFSGRIKIARALHWISDDVRKDLDTVRDIRNKFAHSPDHRLSFSDQSIAATCRNLRSARAFLAGVEERIADPGPRLSAQVFAGVRDTFAAPRQRFQLAVSFISQHLDDIPADASSYQGGDLCDEVRRLGSATDFRISATATVTDP